MKTGSKKILKSSLPTNSTPLGNVVHSQQPLLLLNTSSPNLVRRVKDWKVWAYTDDSCHIHHGEQVIVVVPGALLAGVYHPDSDGSNYV
eukprot:1157960-Pelagomonas_calceolata.AAC.10